MFESPRRGERVTFTPRERFIQGLSDELRRRESGSASVCEEMRRLIRNQRMMADVTDAHVRLALGPAVATLFPHVTPDLFLGAMDLAPEALIELAYRELEDVADADPDGDLDRQILVETFVLSLARELAYQTHASTQEALMHIRNDHATRALTHLLRRPDRLRCLETEIVRLSGTGASQDVIADFASDLVERLALAPECGDAQFGAIIASANQSITSKLTSH